VWEEGDREVSSYPDWSFGVKLKISLLVIRCKDIDVSKNFYELLGLSFVKEKHGMGPEHYSCGHDGCVFELYPNKGEAPKDNNRLGFTVLDASKTITQLNVIDTYEYNDKTIYVAIDPDGRKIEIQ